MTNRKAITACDYYQHCYDTVKGTVQTVQHAARGQHPQTPNTKARVNVVEANTGRVPSPFHLICKDFTSPQGAVGLLGRLLPHMNTYSIWQLVASSWQSQSLSCTYFRIPYLLILMFSSRSTGSLCFLPQDLARIPN